MLLLRCGATHSRSQPAARECLRYRRADRYTPRSLAVQSAAPGSSPNRLVGRRRGSENKARRTREAAAKPKMNSSTAARRPSRKRHIPRIMHWPGRRQNSLHAFSWAADALQYFISRSRSWHVSSASPGTRSRTRSAWMRMSGPARCAPAPVWSPGEHLHAKHIDCMVEETRH